MKPGDACIVDSESARVRTAYRHYGIITSVGSKKVKIRLYDGTEIKRYRNQIAVYVRLPTNWNELYQRQKVKIQNI